MKKNNKGFTLIELLAIIVILAIIAVITIPIILNVIENSRKVAAIDSAYGYKDAISKYYVSEMIDKPDLKLIDGAYTVTKDGFLTKEGTEYKIATSGTVPSSGWVAIVENTVTEGCLTIGDYRVKLKDNNIIAEKGKCKFGGDKVEENLPTGVKAIVYLDPTDLTNECNEEKASKNVNENGNFGGVKIGCMKWYAFDENEENDTYTMILDHDTTVNVAWIRQDDYDHKKEGTTKPGNVGIIYPDGIEPVYDWDRLGHRAKGPIILLKKLQDDTEDWSNSLIRNDSYSVENLTSKTGLSINYTINYSGYKARLITVEEVAEITGQQKTKLQDIPQTGFSFGSYSWLIDNTFVYNGGYWTPSPIANEDYIVWVMEGGNRLLNSGVTADSFGVRPVITVSKSLLAKD